VARHVAAPSSFGLELRCEWAGIRGINPYQFESLPWSAVLKSI
jgi:hypothetical protein